MNRLAAKILALGGYGAFCAWFTYRYVPLVPGYLAVLAPILLALGVQAWRDERKGLVLFSFLFPLVNVLPYFFGLGEGLPLAPAALCAFLAFYLGKIAGGLRGRGAAGRGEGEPERNSRAGGDASGKILQSGANAGSVADAGGGINLRGGVERDGGKTAEGCISARESAARRMRGAAVEESTAGIGAEDGKISLPLTMLAAWGWISAVVAFLRYMDFFPFAASGVHELRVNAAGLTTGGARMSVVFAAASLLAGIAMFGVYKRACADRRMRDRLVGAMAAAAAIAFFFGLLQKALASPLGNTSYWRKLDQVNATFKDPNSLAAFSAAFLPVVIAFAVGQRGWRRAALIAVGCAGIVLLPLSGSRSGIVAIAVAAAAFLLDAFWRTGRKTRLKVGAVVAAILLAFVLWNTVIVHDSSLAERIGWSLYQLKEETAPGDFFNHRLALWNGARRMFREAPLTGVGLGAFIVQFPDYLRAEPGAERYTDTALNLAIHIGAEMGMIGLALTLLFLGALAGRMLRIFREAAGAKPRDWIGVGAVSGLAAFFFLFLFHTYAASYEIQFLFWFLAAVVFAATGRKAGGAETALGDGLGDADGVRSGRLGVVDDAAGKGMAGETSHAPSTTREKRAALAASGVVAGSERGDHDGSKAERPLVPVAPFVSAKEGAKRRLFVGDGGKKRGAVVCLLAVGALLAGGIVFLVFSLGPYSIHARAEKGGWKLEYGLYAEEPDAEVGTFRWTSGEAGFSLAAVGGAGQDGRVELMVRALNPDLGRQPVSVKVYSADKHFRKIDEIGSGVLKDALWTKLTLDPSLEFSYKRRSDGAEGPLYLVVEPDRTWNPKQMGLSPDARTLGICLK